LNPRALGWAGLGWAGLGCLVGWLAGGLTGRLADGRLVVVDIHDYLWISMDIHGYPWMSMDINGYPCFFMGISSS